ncbi:MAG: tetratricopeptide repeat protein [Victivallaceae bacterium]|nr:tetratricopeptide repeat protein [Victivallaceae bacterium]
MKNIFLFLCTYALLFCPNYCTGTDFKEVKPEGHIRSMPYNDLEKEGVALFLEKKYDKAKMFFNEMLRRQNLKKDSSKKELGVIYYSFGRIAQSENKLSQAIIFFEKAVRLYNEQPFHDKVEADLYFYLAVAYSHNKENEKALKCSKDAISLAKTTYGLNVAFTASCIVNYAMSLHKMKQNNESIKALTEAHKIFIFVKDEESARRVKNLLKKWTSE